MGYYAEHVRMNTFVVIDKIFAEMVDDSNDRFLTQLIIYSRPPLTANKHETAHHMCSKYIYQFTTHQSVYVLEVIFYPRVAGQPAGRKGDPIYFKESNLFYYCSALLPLDTFKYFRNSQTNDFRDKH